MCSNSKCFKSHLICFNCYENYIEDLGSNVIKKINFFVIMKYLCKLWNLDYPNRDSQTSIIRGAWPSDTPISIATAPVKVVQVREKLRQISPIVTIRQAAS